jgi:hypothetical protein
VGGRHEEGKGGGDSRASVGFLLFVGIREMSSPSIVENWCEGRRRRRKGERGKGRTREDLAGFIIYSVG